MESLRDFVAGRPMPSMEPFRPDALSCVSALPVEDAEVLDESLLAWLVQRVSAGGTFFHSAYCNTRRLSRSMNEPPNDMRSEAARLVAEVAPGDLVMVA